MMADFGWISFQKRLRITEEIALLGGQCQAMLDELSAHPVKPQLANRIRSVCLSKGLQGTTAIEGNTLTVEQVREIVESRSKPLPPSRQHLQKEIVNVLDAYQFVSGVAKRRPGTLLAETTVLRIHELVVRDLDHIEAEPGRYRSSRVVVGSVYVPPDHGAVPDLVKRLGEWIEEERFAENPFLNGIVKAVVAHVYLAWIHPFDDGNGRTARAVEFGLLQRAGVPEVGAILLANHYNLTRELYMANLRRTSTECRGDLTEFLRYSLEGLRDSLGEALQEVRHQVFLTSWENFIFEQFRREFGPSLTVARARARAVALWMSGQSEPVGREDIVGAPGLAGNYASRTRKALTRDLSVLKKLDLIREVQPGRYRTNSGLMNAFRMIIEGGTQSARTTDEGQLGLFESLGIEETRR